VHAARAVRRIKNAKEDITSMSKEKKNTEVKLKEGVIFEIFRLKHLLTITAYDTALPSREKKSF